MLTSALNKTILSTLAAASVATSLSLNLAIAGEGGGGIARGFKPSVAKPYNPKAAQHVNSARAARYIAMRQRFKAAPRTIVNAPLTNANSNR